MAVFRVGRFSNRNRLGLQRIARLRSRDCVPQSRLDGGFGIRPSLFPLMCDLPTASIVFKVGDRFNPLEKNSLKNALIFFNGDDPEQVTWAQKQNQTLKGRVLLILVNGSMSQVQSHFPQKHVYFDQGGRLTQKLQITQIPAVVEQVGKQLEISEVKP